MNSPTMNGKHTPSTNGTPEKRFELPSEKKTKGISELACRVKVRRVEPGQSLFVRILSESYGGIYTHYFKGRSHYCPGSECLPIVHREKKIWKGYCAADAWDKGAKLWYPCVLEISESLELDFRGVFGRGQMWNLFRESEEKQGEPIRGTLEGRIAQEDLPAPFDYVPVVKTLYHWIEALPLCIKNPLPPRVILLPASGDSPEEVAAAYAGEEAFEEPGDELDAEYRERVRRFRAQNR